MIFELNNTKRPPLFVKIQEKSCIFARVLLNITLLLMSNHNMKLSIKHTLYNIYARVSLVALIILSSCSNATDDEPQRIIDDGDPIVFSSVVSEEEQQMGSRATSTTNLEDIYQSFMVYGYKDTTVSGSGTSASPYSYGSPADVFQGYTVNWASAGSYWEYINQQPSTSTITQSTKYWDYSATAYRYLAYAPSTATNVAYERSADGSQATLTFSSLDAANSDAVFFSHLWFSNGSLADYPTRQFGKPVNLEFKRSLSRVRYYFIFGDAITDPTLMKISGYDTGYVDDSSGSPAPAFASTDATEKVYTKGTLTVAYPISGTAIAETYSTTPDASSATTLKAGKTYTTVLPACSDQHDYQLTVTVNGEECTAIVPSEYMTWLPGYAYTYVFKITDAKVILFDAKVEEWKLGDTQSMTITDW